jgi:hypothetical protein
MRWLAGWFGVTFILVGSLLARGDEPIRPTQRIALFDGQTLGDCYTYLQDTKYEDPRRVFRVTDGLLHITGDGLGSIITRKEYRDYHLVLEFRWGEKTYGSRSDRARDTGLLIHSRGADGGYGGIWMPSLEVQIIEGGLGDFILVTGNDRDGKPVPISVTCETGRDRDGEVIWQRGGQRETFNVTNRRRINWFGRDPDWADRLGFRGRSDLDRAQSEWTRMDVICDGPKVQVFVNGTQVNEALEVQPDSGRIQLQSELAEVFFRRWELYPVGQGPQPAPAGP